MNKPKDMNNTNDELTKEVEDSFPASDPPSSTQPGTSAGAPDKRKSSDTGVEAELARQLAEQKK